MMKFRVMSEGTLRVLRMLRYTLYRWVVSIGNIVCRSFMSQDFTEWFALVKGARNTYLTSECSSLDLATLAGNNFVRRTFLLHLSLYYSAYLLQTFRNSQFATGISLSMFRNRNWFDGLGYCISLWHGTT